MDHTEDDLRRLILWTIAMVVLTGAIGWAANLARDALLLIYVSVLMAIGFAPVVRFIETQKLLPVGGRFPRWLAILTVYVAIIGFITVVAALILPPLSQQARAFWDHLPRMLDQAQSYVISKGWLRERITLQQAVQASPVSGTDVVTPVIQALSGFAGGLIGVLTILILTFYFLLETDSWFASFIRLFPRSKRKSVAVAARDITTKVSAWLTGQLLLGAIVGTSSAVGLWLLGIPYFYVLALISGIGEMIPVVGPILAAIPAIAVAFSLSTEKALFVLIFFVVQQQIENHVLVPKIMEQQVGVSAVTVIIALLIGGSVLGIVGAILAVPTAAILQVLIQETLRDDDRASTAGRSA